MLFSEYLFRCFSAYEKIVELYKWYNLKTRLFKKYISTTNLKEELIGSVSSLDPLSIGENIRKTKVIFLDEYGFIFFYSFSDKYHSF